MKFEKLLGPELCWIEDCLLEYEVPRGAIDEICLTIIQLKRKQHIPEENTESCDTDSMVYVENI